MLAMWQADSHTCVYAVVCLASRLKVDMMLRYGSHAVGLHPDRANASYDLSAALSSKLPLVMALEDSVGVVLTPARLARLQVRQ